MLPGYHLSAPEKERNGNKSVCWASNIGEVLAKSSDISPICDLLIVPKRSDVELVASICKKMFKS